MIPFVTIGASERGRALRFYDAVLFELDFEHAGDDERWLVYGPKGSGRREIFVGSPYTGKTQAGNGIMVAIEGGTTEAVERAHRAGIDAGGSDEGAPGHRPANSSWYGAYLRDPDGNKICICVNC